ncbi:hypothetical protein N878_00415 [Pseudomonas sp. EGD-AK9]|nr:hypothetical protein N878_00415 [Pseudomonas sp. EGD-AK9]
MLQSGSIPPYAFEPFATVRADLSFRGLLKNCTARATQGSLRAGTSAQRNTLSIGRTTKTLGKGLWTTGSFSVSTAT